MFLFQSVFHCFLVHKVPSLANNLLIVKIYFFNKLTINAILFIHNISET